MALLSEEQTRGAHLMDSQSMMDSLDPCEDHQWSTKILEAWGSHRRHRSDSNIRTSSSREECHRYPTDSMIDLDIQCDGTRSDGCRVRIFPDRAEVPLDGHG